MALGKEGGTKIGSYQIDYRLRAVTINDFYPAGKAGQAPAFTKNMTVETK